ncbi:Beta-lactamase [Altererythrobacter insulae]|nr:Beta-lactamase [Altererythrobacter insulae]
MRLLMALSALLSAWTVQAAWPDPAIERFLEAEMKSSGAPGISYGTLIDGQIATAERGVSELGLDSPVAPESAFLVGSISKSFTSLAVMQLIEAEKLELDAPISLYLDSFEPGTSAGDTSIRQLMSHTSGYSMYQGNKWQSDSSMAPDALVQRVEEIASMKPDQQPGQRWDYSNINYMLLGRLIEVASGKSYAVYVETNILKPAGMSDSFVHAAATHERLVTGHTPWFLSKRVMRQNGSGLAASPQGGIVSTAGDMLLYLGLMMNGQDDILSAAGKRQMMTPASTVSPDYGFGWFLNTEQGIVSHSGSNPGYEALATMVPDERKAAVILVNSGSGFALKNGFAMQYGFIDRALGIEEDPGLPGSGAIWMLAYLVFAPLLFAISIIVAWRGKAKLRAKSGVSGLLSLWFPLVAVGAQALILFILVPRLFGAPLSAVWMFQPDSYVLIVAAATSGLVWAIARLAIAYSARDSAA